MTRSYLGAYWDARAETVDQCAARTAALLKALAGIDPLLSDWRGKGKSRRDALAQAPVTTEHADLVTRLMAGQNRTDVGNEVIEDLGYSVSWWNSRENRDGGITVSLRLGVTSQFVGNSVVINLPDSSSFPRLYTPAVANAIMSNVISIFEPERAVWTSSDLTKAQAEPDEILDNGGIAYGKLIGHPAGWSNYLADTSPLSFDDALLPRSAKTAHVDSGTLVTLGNDPTTPRLADVLAVRLSMGYPVSQSADIDGAASGNASAEKAPVDAVKSPDAAEGEAGRPQVSKPANGVAHTE